MVATDSRATFTSMSNVGLVLGGMSLALIKWLVPYWRTYARVIYAPMLLYIFLIYLIDESPRWLLTKGKMNVVVRNIKNAAKLNKIEIKENLSLLTYEKETSSNFMTVITKTLKSKSLLKRFFICIIWWNTCTFVDFGLLVNSVLLEGNKYVNYALTAFVRLPAAMVSAILLNKYKRKGPLMLSFVVCAVLCISHPFTPESKSTTCFVFSIQFTLILFNNFIFILPFSFFDLSQNIIYSDIFLYHFINSLSLFCSFQFFSFPFTTRIFYPLNSPPSLYLKST